MNLIKQLGGYDNARDSLRWLAAHDDEYVQDECDLYHACLEYRRENNIFEVGDKVVSINSAFIEYQGVLNIDFIDKFNLMLSDDSKGFEVNAICGWSKIIRHATKQEIAQGYRYE